MRGGAWPPGLLFCALGLALASAPRRFWAPSLCALLATVAVLSVVPIPDTWREGVYMGCWLSVIATAASVHFQQGVGVRRAIAMSINVGLWAGAMTSLAGSPLDLLKALPGVSIVFVASALLSRRCSVAVKVASSWLIAIAVLAATLQLLPVTPGYLPDHME